MVDRGILAGKTAAVEDAVRQIREVLPANADALRGDRLVRESVILNLFVAIQECVSLASHALSDGGWSVPSTYAAVFLSLADHGILSSDLARRLGSAAGFRNLIAHRYGDIDTERLYAIASTGPDDLLAFCAELAKHITT